MTKNPQNFPKILKVKGLTLTVTVSALVFRVKLNKQSCVASLTQNGQLIMITSAETLVKEQLRLVLYGGISPQALFLF